MKNLLKKATAVGAAMITMLSFAACGRSNANNIEKDHKNETIIYVQNYDCGYGREYVENTARRFMDAVKDVSYETGKKGVYVSISHTKNNATGSYLMNDLPNNNAEVFFTESTTPAMLKSSSMVMNINDIVNEKKGDDGASVFSEDKSIMERMYPDYRNYYSTNDEVYAVPLFMSSNILTYDIDACDEKGLWIQEGSTDEKLILSKNKENRSKGVDGIAGTSDDGLPETWAQLYLWFDEIAKKGMYALNFQGVSKPSVDASFFNYFADFEGAENFKMNYTFSGTATDLVDTINDDGTVTYLPATEINYQNGYLLTKQEGRYRATEVLKKIADNFNTWCHPQSFSSSETHTESQTTYIGSKYATNSKRIVCFAHGAYWESEARGAFEAYESQNGGRLDRRFAPLPTPKYYRKDVGVGSRTTVMSGSNSTMIVKKGVDESKLNVIKDLIAFFNSSEQMSKQLSEATVSRPFYYDIADEDTKDLSTYQKELYKFYHDERVDIVFASDKNAFYCANVDDFHTQYWMFGSKPTSGSATTLDDGTTYYFKNNKNTTVAQMFYGYYNRFNDNKEIWKTRLERAGIA